MTRQSDTGRLLQVAMKHPRDAFVSQAAINEQWRALHFLSPPDFTTACHEFDVLVRLLEDSGTAIHLLPADAATGLDSIYARDASLATDAGLVLCSMGKALRSGEPAAQGMALLAIGLDIRGAVVPPGRVEGGDLTWLDRRTLAVGHGYRTNAEGIRQLRELLAGSIDDLIVVPLPHWRGTNDVMHLMSLVSPLTENTVLTHSPLLPVPFRSMLLDRGFTLIDVDPDEFDTMGGNVLAIGPRTVLALDGNPRTRRRLEAAAFQVLGYQGMEISVKGAGGPTCLTRPLQREA